MPNPYFQFKQFTVYHDKCAMKVGTDGVLLGAWADVEGVTHALDIGTGSGLVALMIAQRSNASVTGIDIDKGAYTQSKENFERSEWTNRLQVYHKSLQEFANNYVGEKFDLIVSNPPYFQNSYKPPRKDRSLARHSDQLTLKELIENADRLLSEEGKLSLVLPFETRDNLWVIAKERGLVVTKFTAVYPKPGKPAKRCLFQLERHVDARKEDELWIEEGDRHEYSEGFKRLLKGFYLAF